MKEKKNNSNNEKKVDDTQTSNKKVVKWIIVSIVLAIIVFVIMILLGIIPGNQEKKFDGCYKSDDENVSLCFIGSKAELSDAGGLYNFKVIKNEDEENIYIKNGDSTKFVCQISSDSNSQLECVNKIDDSVVLSYNKTYYFNKIDDSSDIKNGKFRTLYKYTVDDFDYSLLYKVYKYKYTNTPGTVGRDGNVFIFLTEGSSDCLFTQQEQIEDQFSTNYSATSTSCSYSIDNNKVSINGAIKSITTYKPDPLSSKTESFSKTDTLDLTGEITDNGKYLQIGETKYYQINYLAVSNMYSGDEAVYYDPDGNTLYDAYGFYVLESNFAAIPEGSETQKIDLSMYNIVDKTSKDKSDTDSSEKQQEEKNNGVPNESTKVNEKIRYSKKDYKYANLSKLNYSQYEELYNSDKPFVVILTQSTCNYSKQYIPVIKKYVNKENVPVYILEIDSIGEEDTKKVISSLSYFEDNDAWGTPLTLAIKDKVVVNDLVGFTDEQSKINDFFKSIYG